MPKYGKQRTLRKRSEYRFNPLTQVKPLMGVWASDPLWTPPGDGKAVGSMRNTIREIGDPTAFGTQQPLYIANTAALGERPAIKFDGSDDTMQLSLVGQAVPFKVLLVAAYTISNPSSVNILGLNSVTSSAGIGSNASNKHFIGNTTSVVSAVSVDTKGHVFRATFGNGAGASSLWIDEVNALSNQNAGSSTADTFTLGTGDIGSARQAPCSIAFAAMYAGTTDDAQLIGLAKDLKTYYGLSA